MMNDPLFLMAAAATLVVLAILALGLASFTRGGDGRSANKLMQARIIAQFVAVILIVLFVYIRRTTGG